MTSKFGRTARWGSVAGIATMAGAAVAPWAGFATPAGAAPTLGDNAHTLRLGAAEPGDGVYESCSPYFGFGKADGALDVVAFDVSDVNGADAFPHAVAGDTRVVFVVHGENGGTLECMPDAITEAQWDQAVNDFSIYVDTSDPRWSYPGPGHYAYPTVIYGPYYESIHDAPFGKVTSVGFKVVDIPTGHTLESPVGEKPLVQHYPIGDEYYSSTVDDRVLDFIEGEAGAGAVDAFQSTLALCSEDFPDFDASDELVTAMNAIADYRGWEPYDAEGVDCGAVLNENSEVSFLLALEATRSYREAITLSLPEEPTTTTTTTTLAPPPAAAAVAVPATPRYTG